MWTKTRSGLHSSVFTVTIKQRFFSPERWQYKRSLSQISVIWLGWGKKRGLLGISVYSQAYILMENESFERLPKNKKKESVRKKCVFIKWLEAITYFILVRRWWCNKNVEEEEVGNCKENEQSLTFRFPHRSKRICCCYRPYCHMLSGKPER